MRRVLAAATSVLLLLAVAGCGDGDDSSETLTVFAAASLASSFTALADRFEDEHDDVEVRLSFGGSADLAAQIVEGAPADVFASADERTMATVVESGATDRDPVVFATNTLLLATPADNPARIRTVDDLADPEVKVVLCAAQVPCGSAARKVLGAAGVEVVPVSEEQSVTDVLGKVTSGEADAGLVYRTDVSAAGDAVRAIALPGSEDVVNLYPIVPIDRGDGNALAEEFAAFVAGPDARAVLADAGFGAP